MALKHNELSFMPASIVVDNDDEDDDDDDDDEKKNEEGKPENEKKSSARDEDGNKEQRNECEQGKGAGRGLVALTESPHNNWLEWGRQTWRGMWAPSHVWA